MVPTSALADVSTLTITRPSSINGRACEKTNPAELLAKRTVPAGPSRLQSARPPATNAGLGTLSVDRVEHLSEEEIRALLAGMDHTRPIEVTRIRYKNR